MYCKNILVKILIQNKKALFRACIILKLVPPKGIGGFFNVIKYVYFIKNNFLDLN